MPSPGNDTPPIVDDAVARRLLIFTVPVNVGLAERASDPQEPVGSMMDLFARRGMYPYGVADMVQWARTGVDPGLR